jgi:hypothetical protein
MMSIRKAAADFVESRDDAVGMGYVWVIGQAPELGACVIKRVGKLSERWYSFGRHVAQVVKTLPTSFLSLCMNEVTVPRVYI